MVAHSKDYSAGDEYENAVDRMLNNAWNKPFTKLNRIIENGKNKSQVIWLSESESYILPDITVFYNSEENEVEFRVEVKGFHCLPTRESPNKNLPLFPIKQRQLQEYWQLFKKEEVMCKIVIVVGDKHYSNEFSYYWSSIYDIVKLEKIKSPWDGEMAYWFNINDMNVDFSDF